MSVGTVLLAAVTSLSMVLQAMFIGVGLLLVFEAYLQTIDSPLWLSFNRLNPFGHLSLNWKVLGGTCCVIAGTLAHLLLRFSYGSIVPGG